MTIDIEVTKGIEEPVPGPSLLIPLAKLWKVTLPSDGNPTVEQAQNQHTTGATKGWDYHQPLPVVNPPPVHLPFLDGSQEVPAGVTIVLGQAASGKTQLSLYLQSMGAERVAFREPSENALVSEAALALAIALFLEDANQSILVIDSFRTFLYTGEVAGGTAKGGVSMGVYALLTILDLVARAKGKLIVVLLNPMSAGEDEFEVQKLAAIGSVGSVVVTERPGFAQLSSRYGRNRGMKAVNYPLDSRPPDHEPKAEIRIVSAGGENVADPLGELLARVHHTYSTEAEIN